MPPPAPPSFDAPPLDGELLIDPLIAQRRIDWIFNVDVGIDATRATIFWDRLIKPWFDVWLPGTEVERYVGEVMPTLTPRDVGPTGFLLIFALRRSSLTRRSSGCPSRTATTGSTYSTSSPHPRCRGPIPHSLTRWWPVRESARHRRDALPDWGAALHAGGLDPPVRGVVVGIRRAKAAVRPRQHPVAGIRHLLNGESYSRAGSSAQR